MKKTYKKPMMIVEWFALSQTIAAGCGEKLDGMGEPLLARRETCAWLYDGFHMFEDPNICLHASEYWEIVCYNAPEGGLNVFHS